MEELIKSLSDRIIKELENINKEVTKEYIQESIYTEKDKEYHTKVKEYQDMIDTLTNTNYELYNNIKLLETEQKKYELQLDFDNAETTRNLILEKQSKISQNAQKIKIIKNVLIEGNEVLKPLAHEHYTETNKYITTLSNKENNIISAFDKFNKVIQECNSILQKNYLEPIKIKQSQISRELNDIRRY